MISDIILQLNAEMLAHRQATELVSQSRTRTRTNKEIMALAMAEFESEKKMREETVNNLKFNKIRSMRGQQGNPDGRFDMTLEEIALVIGTNPSAVEKIYVSALRKMKRAIDLDERFNTLRELLDETEQVVIDSYEFPFTR